MELDDDLCLCFHVTKRKVVNYIRIHRPVKASQLSDCFGAGTGCGWCRPFLQRLMEQAKEDLEQTDDGLPDTQSYASGRQLHRKNKGLA